MSVIHIKKRENPYVQIDKSIFNNANISWKAKGMLGYLLSKPSDWKTYIADLEKRSTDGRDSTRNGINELIEAGYIIRLEVREKGRFKGYDYYIYETPVTENGFSEIGKTEIGNSEIGKSNTTNNELTNNELTNNDIELAKPTKATPLTRKNNKKKVERIAYAHNVFLTKRNYESLCKEFGKEVTDKKIIGLSKYQDDPSKKTYAPAHHYRTLKNWLSMDGKSNGGRMVKTPRSDVESDILRRLVEEDEHKTNSVNC